MDGGSGACGVDGVGVEQMRSVAASKILKSTTTLETSFGGPARCLCSSVNGSMIATLLDDVQRENATYGATTLFCN